LFSYLAPSKSLEKCWRQKRNLRTTTVEYHKTAFCFADSWKVILWQ
jgi:hypothetical protein